MTLDIAEDNRGDGTVIVRFVGQFDFAHVGTARAVVNRCAEEGATYIVANLDGLEYIDSAGLGVLVGTLARLREHGGKLAVVCRSARIRRVFDITKLTQLMPLYDSDEAAIRGRAA